MKRLAFFLPLLAVFVVSGAFAQTLDFSQLDPKPWQAGVDPDPDMFMSSYQESHPRHVYGTLLERDILTPNDGDPLFPKTRGAVLTNLKAFCHGTLQAKNATEPATLKDEQRIFYVSGGKGVIETKKTRAELHEGVGVIVPPGIEFEFMNTGDSEMTMYILTERIPDGFKPKKDIVVNDENVIPFASSNVHWCHCYKGLFRKEDGLATLRGMGPVWFNPMTMGQPHSHPDGTEEIWFSLNGDIQILLGKQLRAFPPGMAYKIPPNGVSAHSTINVTDKPVKVFWFMN